MLNGNKRTKNGNRVNRRNYEGNSIPRCSQCKKEKGAANPFIHLGNGNCVSVYNKAPVSARQRYQFFKGFSFNKLKYCTIVQF